MIDTARTPPVGDFNLPSPALSRPGYEHIHTEADELLDIAMDHELTQQLPRRNGHLREMGDANELPLWAFGQSYLIASKSLLIECALH